MKYLFANYLLMKIISFALLLSVLTISACQKKPVSTESNDFLNYFKPLSPQDTLVFDVANDGNEDNEVPRRDTIPTALLYAQVSDSLREPISHLLEVDAPHFASLGRFALDEKQDALLVNLDVSWFKNQSLLIFDKNLQKVVALLPVAEFYGGDGGQILRKSWLITSDGQKQWVARESQHTMQIKGDNEEPTHLYEDWGKLYTWQNGAFREVPVQDSAALIRQFPIGRFMD